MFNRKGSRSIAKKTVSSIVAFIAPFFAVESLAVEVELPKNAMAESAVVRINGSVSYASNYHYRGIDLSQENNVVQYSLSLDQALLGRVGLWSTEMESPLLPTQRRHSNIFYGKDLTINSDFTVGLGVARYHFDSDAGSDVYYTEWDMSLYYQNSFTWRTHYSEKLYGFPSPAWVTDIEYTQPLSRRADLRAGAGYSYLEKSVPLNYANYLVGIDYAFENFLIEVSYHITTSSAKKLYGVHADNRVMAAISVGF